MSTEATTVRYPKVTPMSGLEKRSHSRPRFLKTVSANRSAQRQRVRRKEGQWQEPMHTGLAVATIVPP